MSVRNEMPQARIADRPESAAGRRVGVADEVGIHRFEKQGEDAGHTSSKGVACNHKLIPLHESK